MGPLVALFGRRAVPLHGGVQIESAAGAFLMHHAEGVLRPRIALPGCPEKPLARFLQVGGAADSLAEKHPERVLRVRFIQSSGAAEPGRRHDVVGFDAVAVAIHHAQIIARAGVTLGRRPAIPFEGGGGVPRHLVTLAQQGGEAHLRRRVADLGGHPKLMVGVVHPIAGAIRRQPPDGAHMALRGGGMIPAHGFLEIAFDPAAAAIQLGQFILGHGQPEGRRFAEPARRRGLVGLHAGPGKIQPAQPERRFGVALLGGAAIPQGGLLEVEHDDLAQAVEIAEQELGDGKTEFGGLAEQGDPGDRVGIDAEALDIHVAEIGLGARAALIGGPPIPFQRPRIIALDPLAESIEMTEIGLRPGVAVLRQGAPLHCRLGIIALVEGPLAIPESGPGGGRQAGNQYGGECQG